MTIDLVEPYTVYLDRRNELDIWQRPTRILNARVGKFSVQFDY
jgi:hypothetical protein